MQNNKLLCYCFYLLLLCTGSFVLSCNNAPSKEASGTKIQSQEALLSRRIFYFLNQAEQSPKIKNALSQDKKLAFLHNQRVQRIKEAVADCPDMDCLVNALIISTTENDSIVAELSRFYAETDQVRIFMDKKIRSSNKYILNAHLSDSAFFINTWKEEMEGLNYILHGYLQNEGLHYAFIDSSLFDVNSTAYLDTVKQVIKNIIQGKENGTLFFQPALDICLSVLKLNDRDEAARFLPLTSVNRDAYNKIPKTDWNAFDYSSILIFGHGPEKKGVAIDEINKERCRMGAAYYKEKKAPFIIVSGGYVHPFQTPYCEAQEMKRYLMDSLNIPGSAVIMEPHARHTTTNIRDANRIIFNQNIPPGKPVLGVTSEKHIDYIVASRFKKACKRDFGYVPFSGLKRIAKNAAAFYPSKKSLQVNTLTPLDP